VHHPEHPAVEVGAAAERVDQRQRADVAGDRVDREVAPLEVVAHRKLGVRLDAEVGVGVARVVGLAGCDRRLAPRRHDLDALARPPGRPEAHAHEAAGDAQLVGLAVRTTDGEQLLDAVPAHEEVDVLRLAPEQLVAQ